MKSPPLLCGLTVLVLTTSASHAGFRNFQAADLVLGQTFGGTTGLHDTAAAAVDPVSKKVFVCDTGNNRVLRYASVQSLGVGSRAEAVLGQGNFLSAGPFSDYASGGNTGMDHPSDLVLDEAGRLWVADTGHNRILRFDNAAGKATGAPADGVLGQPDFFSSSAAVTSSGVSKPSGLAVSGTTLFVADKLANRVLRFDQAATKANGAPAQAVFGQVNFTTSTAGLSHQKLSAPAGLAVDAQGGQLTLWVADRQNHRVLAFANAGTATVNPPASRVLGQSSFTTNASGLSASKLNSPGGVAFQEGALYVSDTNNNRILRWNTPYAGNQGTDATGVFGQPDLTTGSPAANSAQYPEKLSVDSNGSLWATEPNATGNPFSFAVVMNYKKALTKAPGAPRDLVLNEPISEGIGSMYARGVAVSANSGKVFVSENHRVLRFASLANLHTGSPPEAVLGQPDMTSTVPGAGASRMNNPTGLVCSVNDELWVSDKGNHRVLRFTNASTTGTGAAAANVLGQSAFGLSASGTTVTNLKNPAGLALDGNGTLWVADAGNSRVLRFDLATLKSNGAPANGVLGQSNYGNATQGLSDKSMNTPTAVATGSGGRLWVLDAGNNRVLRYENAANKANNASADGVLGQPHLFSNTTGKAAHEMNTTPSNEGPGGLAVDGTGRLYVQENLNCRITWFNAAATRANGAAADGLLGQPNFGAREVLDDPRHFSETAGMALDSRGALWVTDNGNYRVLRFSSSLPAVASCGLDSGKHFYMNLLTQSGSTYQIERSPDLKTWTDYGDPFTTAFDFYAWANPLVAGTRNFFRVREVAP